MEKKNTDQVHTSPANREEQKNSKLLHLPQQFQKNEFGTKLKTIAADIKKILHLIPDDSGGVDPDLPKYIKLLKEHMDELASSGYLDQFHQQANNLIDSQLNDLPMTLKQFSETKGFHFWGGFPDHIVDGTVYLGINLKRYSVTINEISLPLFPIKIVLSNLDKEISRVTAESFNTEQFLQELWSAYHNCLRKKGVSKDEFSQTRVPIFHLISEMAFLRQKEKFLKNPVQHHFRGYSQHKFRADLFRLLSRQAAPTIERHRLILEPTSVAEDGLFMYLPTIGRCAFVGRAVFSQIE